MIKGVKSHHFCNSPVLSTLKRGEDIQGIVPSKQDHRGCPRILLTKVIYYNNVLNVCLYGCPSRAETESLSWLLLCFWYLKYSSSLWQLILRVHWTKPWGAQAFGQTLFWVCLWMCLDEMSMWIMGWVEQIVLSNVGGFSLWVSSKETTYRCRRCGFSPWIRKIPLEKEMTTHSSILAWEIPGTEEPGGLQSMGLQKNQTWPSD